MYSESSHWRMMNRMARVLGIFATLAGLAFTKAAVQYNNNPTMAAQIPSASGSATTDAVAVAIFAFVLGILFLIVKPYRPDLRKAEPTNGTQRYSWWTGEPK